MLPTQVVCHTIAGYLAIPDNLLPQTPYDAPPCRYKGIKVLSRPWPELM